MAAGLTSKTLGGAGALLAGSAIQSAVGFVVLATLSRLINPSDFGIIAAALIVISFSQLFSQLGVGQALIQRPEITLEHRRVGFTSSVILGFIVAGIIALAAPLIANFFRLPELVPVLRVLAIAFPIQAVSTVAECLLQRDLLFGRLSILNAIAQTFGYGAVGIICAFAGMGVWALVAAEIGRVSTRMLLSLMYERDSFGISFNTNALRDIFSFGAGYSFVRLANYLANQGDNIVIARLGSAGDLGFYSRAYNLVMIPAYLLGTIADRVLFPVLSAIQTDRARLRRGFMRALAVGVLLSSPLAACGVVLGPEVIFLVLGDGWQQAALPFQILAAVLTMRTSYKVCDSLVRSVGAVYQHAKNHAWLAATIFAGAIAGMQWGIGGVATGVAVALIINYTLMLRLCCRVVELEPKALVVIHLRHLCWFLVSVALASWCKWEVHSLGPVVTVLAASGVIGMLYSICLWVYPRLLGEEGEWASNVVKTTIRSRFSRS